MQLDRPMRSLMLSLMLSLVLPLVSMSLTSMISLDLHVARMHLLMQLLSRVRSSVTRMESGRC